MNQARRRPTPVSAYLLIAAFLVLMALPSWTTTALLVVTALVLAYRAYQRLTPAKLSAPPDGALLGHDADNNPITLSDRQLSAHGLILGASGAGKTTTLLSILAEQIARGRPVIAIDLKGSPAVADGLRAATSAAGRTFRLWTPDGPAPWNPLARGNPTELKDKLISTEQWSEPHYKRAAERYLQTALQVMQASAPGRPVTLRQVVEILEPKRLAAALGKLPKDDALRVREYLSSLTPDQRSGVAGLASRLAVIAESHTGRYLEPDGSQTIDLRRSLEAREVVLFSLNASTYGQLAAHLAALVIQDLTVAAGHRLTAADRRLAFIAIDEFSALQHDNVLALIARARDAGISVLLTTQELADLERVAGLRDQILGNVVLTIAHRQNVPSSAELIARLIGTNTVWQQTLQTDSASGLFGALMGRAGDGWETGLGSKREVEEFRIHPNVIKELPTGAAVLITKLPKASARVMRISPPVLGQPQAQELVNVS